MRDDSFEHIIKNKIKDIEIVPPQIVWDNIDNQINQSLKLKKIIISSITTIAASVIIALSFNFLIADKDILIEQINIAKSIKEPVIEVDNHIKTYKTIHDISIIPKHQFIVKSSIRDSLKRVNLATNNIRRIITCPLNIKQETQDKIAYNNDKVIMYNNIKSEKNIKYKTLIGINLSTGSSFSNVQSSSVSKINNFRTTEFKSTNLSTHIEIPKSEIKLHTNVSFSFEFPIKKNLSLVSGLGYLGFTSKNNKGFYLGDINDIFTNEMIIDKYNSDIKDVKHYFSYLEIPLTMKYSIINNKISVYLNGGLGINLLVNNKSEITLESGESIHNKTKDIKNITYCGIGGLGISTRIFSSFYIKGELQYRYYLKDISSNKALAINKGMTNMSFGLSYKL